MIQMTLFDDDRRRSSIEELRRIRGVFASEVAKGKEVDAGIGQQNEAYPPEIRNAIGPMIAALRRDGFIEIAGAEYASRPTRRRTVARLWRAKDPQKCKQLAERDFAWLAARQKDAGGSAATDSPALDSTTHPASTKEENDGQAK